MDMVEPGTAGSELAHPLPTSSLKPPNILILTPPYAQVGTGAFWGAKLGLFAHLLLGKCSKSGSFAGSPGSEKGAITGLQFGPLSPKSPGTSSAPMLGACLEEAGQGACFKLRGEDFGPG